MLIFALSIYVVWMMHIYTIWETSIYLLMRFANISLTRLPQKSEIHRSFRNNSRRKVIAAPNVTQDKCTHAAKPFLLMYFITV